MAAPDDASQRLTRRIASYREEMVAFQRDLTALRAIGPEGGGDGEWERSRFLLRTLESFGLREVLEFNAADERVSAGLRPNIVVRLPGASRRPAVWVMAHMDTVPPGEPALWDGDPFVIRVDDGKVYGRGVEDNQQGVTAALFALRGLVDEGLTPATDAAVILVADEENGNAYGIDHLLAAAPDLIHPDDLVVVPDFGSPDGAAIEVAEKSILWAEFTVLGKQVHASLPGAGINAHRAAAYLAVRLDEQLHARFAASDTLFDPPTSTFEPTKREANVPNVNTVPGRDVFYFDCRVLPSYDLSEVKAEIQAIVDAAEQEFGVRITVAYPNEAVAAPPTPPDAPVVRALERTLRLVRGVEPYVMGMGGGTVAAAFRRRGIPAAVWGTMEGMAHQPNEFCVIDNLVADALVFAHVFMDAGLERGEHE